MTESTSRRGRAAVRLAGLLLLLSGCTDLAPGAPSCPDTRLTVIELLDVSASGRDSDLIGERLGAIQASAVRVAHCGGSLTIIAFSSSPAAHAVLHREDVAPDGSTAIARWRKAPDRAEQIIKSVREELQRALDGLPADGSDLTAAFVLASDLVGLRLPDEAIEVTIHSDAITTVGPTSVNTAGLTAERASELAELAPAADLSGVTVAIVGVGRVAGSPPPADYIAVARVYALQVCERSHAATCRVTTTGSSS